MDDTSGADLIERFRKRMVVLNANIEKLEKLRAPPTPPTGLLRLPFEIRLQIYGYCIPQKRIIEVSQPHFDTGASFEECTPEIEDNLDIVANEFDPDSEYDTDLQDRALDLEHYVIDHWGDYWNRNKNKNSVFLLSKQISQEALDVLYGDNIFKIHLHGEGEHFFKKNFSEANRQRMRYLLLTAEPRGVSYTPGHMPENSLWCSVLPQLKAVWGIILGRPILYCQDLEILVLYCEFWCILQ